MVVGGRDRRLWCNSFCCAIGNITGNHGNIAHPLAMGLHSHRSQHSRNCRIGCSKFRPVLCLCCVCPDRYGSDARRHRLHGRILQRSGRKSSLGLAFLSGTGHRAARQGPRRSRSVHDTDHSLDVLARQLEGYCASAVDWWRPVMRSTGHTVVCRSRNSHTRVSSLFPDR